MTVTPAWLLAAAFVALLAGVLGIATWRQPGRPELARMADGASWVALLFCFAPTERES